MPVTHVQETCIKFDVSSTSNQVILFAHKIQICFTRDRTRAGQARQETCTCVTGIMRE